MNDGGTMGSWGEVIGLGMMVLMAAGRTEAYSGSQPNFSSVDAYLQSLSPNINIHTAPPRPPPSLSIGWKRTTKGNEPRKKRSN